MAKNVQLTIDIKGNDSVGKAAEKTKSLKTQLRELKAELASGNLVGKAFDDAATKAGQLEDAIKDVAQRVNNLSSDTQKLDGFLDLATGITGGFAAAQGAMALFGDENEEVQKQLVKIQGAVALLNGVQAVANTLNKDSAAMTQLQSVRLKILTAVQGRYTAVVGTTTGAMKLLRLAGAAIPITLLITGIGILIANFDKIKKVVLSFLPGLGQLGDLFTKVKNAVMDFVGISSEAERQEEKAAKQRAVRSQQMQYEIELMEANGASARDLYLAKRKLLFNDLETLKIAAFKKDATQEEIKGYNDLANAIKVLDAEETKRQKDGAEKEKEAANKRAEERKKEQDRIKLEREKNKQEALKQADKDIEDQLKRFEEDQAKLKEARLEAEFALEEERDRRLQKEQEDERAHAENIIAIDRGIQDAKIQAVQMGAQILTQFAGQNKALQLSALAIEKGAAIAGVIINAGRELSANALAAAENPLNSATFGAAGAAQLAKSNALTKIRAGINIASIAAAGISGAKSISGGGSGSGGAVQPPNIRGSQTTNEQATPQPTKVFVTEVDIRSSLRKVDGIYSQSTII